MLPIKAMRLSIGELLAADAAFLAPLAANKIALIIAPFTATEDTVLADLVLATFAGSTPKAGAIGTQQAGINPATGDQVVTNLAPVGGWRWECTADPAIPESVFGYALVDDTVTDLIATEYLAEPVVISQSGEFIDLGSVEFIIVAQPLS